MQHFFSMFFLMLITVAVSGQNAIGIASFTVPAGWQFTQDRNGVTIENKTQKGQVCRILISGTEKTAVNTTELFVQYRTQKTVAGVTYRGDLKSIRQKQTGNQISFGSGGTGTADNVAVQVSFYSFSNGRESFFVQLISSNKECTAQFNQFIGTLTVEEAEDDAGSGKTKAKRARKAAPAAPAAPAPMM